MMELDILDILCSEYQRRRNSVQGLLDEAWNIRSAIINRDLPNLLKGYIRLINSEYVQDLNTTDKTEIRMAFLAAIEDEEWLSSALGRLTLGSSEAQTAATEHADAKSYHEE